jgi:uncharacterized protein YceK
MKALLLVCMLLTGCSTVVYKVEPKFEEELLVPCDTTLAEHTGTNGAAVLSTLTEWSRQYFVCQKRHEAIVEAYRGQERLLEGKKQRVWWWQEPK